MHIAIAGPIATENIASFLTCNTERLPKGYSGAPLLATLIGELLKRGHRVSAFTTSTDMPADRSKWTCAMGDQFQIYYIGQRPHSFRPKFGYLGRAMDFFSVERAALVKAIREANPDVVHAHWAYEFGLSAVESGKPHVVTCHDAPDVVLKFMPNAYRFVRYLMGRHCLAKAGVVTAVSPYLRDAVQKYFKGSVAVVQNPLPDFLFLHSGHTQNSTQASGGEPRRIAMVINGWGSLKNPEPALRAFGLLRSSGHAELELHLYGADFGPGEVAEQWCHKNGLTDDIHFHGCTPHRELLEQLRTMHFMIHPALEESCPMGIAEAMSLGLPVIGGDESGGVPWVIGEGGITTDVTSPQAIADTAKILLSDATVWQACSEAAVSRTCETFTAPVVADLYLGEYLKAMSLPVECNIG
ncbi:glycosyltransferase family 4 protein [Thauera mechernichensis]|uniref:Glycosyltransferase family 4 protein n=1 Tax=Thauera mechernichensis TaxID=82788 RepID=A0ABW3WDU2_9RHOO|nr:glycosyltransferase family 4 protein [Thauera mechernichensis]MDG3064868.1 glycosyltransferase family 4 protein [Thauera mechernichensis]